MKKITALCVLYLLPFVTNAQGFVGPTRLNTGNGLGNVLLQISDIIASITPVIVALALLYFFYGLAKYILNAGDEEKKSEGRSIMIWGIIALFVMVSVWGLVRILDDTFIGGSPTSVPTPGVIINPDGTGSTF